jgi:hypothetical protein
MPKRRFTLMTVALMSLACAASTLGFAAQGRAEAHRPADPSVISDWNIVAARTIVDENATPIPASMLYFGFVSLAVYDAVVAVEGGFDPYLAHSESHADSKASSEAAAASAAYNVLRHYFPRSAANLAQSYGVSVVRAPKGHAARLGQQIGEEAAARVIRARSDDGRNAAVTLDAAVGPGVWRPTPDAFAAMLVPWLGFVEPLLIRSTDQFPLPGPYRLRSRAYARDFDEVKAYGGSTGSARTAWQTETARFYNFHPGVQYRMAVQDQVDRRHLDIVESARAFAILFGVSADAVIACWRAKYDYAYWRPITAIRMADTDGNAETEADVGWTSLVATPPYSDYVSGHACMSGAASGALSHLFGGRAIGLNVFSGVTGTTRHYESLRSLDEETMNARIWLGLHFRKAMTDGNRLGHRVSDWSVRHYFGRAR